eukprot:m.61828 g.61828  ORF g.61828 m.61828 type:complete len:357 (+) comp19306_c0_seq1:251-1321(+)
MEATDQHKTNCQEAGITPHDPHETNNQSQDNHISTNTNHSKEEPSADPDVSNEPANEESSVVTDNEAKDQDQETQEAPETQETQAQATAKPKRPVVLDENGKPLSKNQLKKIRREQRWQETKAERKKKLREKDKARKRRRQELGLPAKRPRRAAIPLSSPEASPLRLAIDVSFHDLMTHKDNMKIFKQICRCYSSNRQAAKPVQYYLTSLTGPSLEILKQRAPEYQNWDMHVDARSYHEVFKKEDIVYLTADSDNVLEELDDSKAYIIGGLVDHNHEKGLCQRLALEKGIATARLPIDVYLDLATRHVLTVNHVFEIMLTYVNSRSWEQSFFEVIPKRKFINEDEVEADTTQKQDS